MVNAGVFVSQSDDPRVASAYLVLGRSCESRIHSRASPLGQKSTQAGVAALGDLAEPMHAAGAGLLGYRARPGGQLAPVAEVARITDDRHEGTGSVRTDAIEHA